MARTVLLRSIRRLASQYRAAAKTGLPAEAIQERQALAVETGQRAFTRRQFLAGTAAAAAGLALPRWSAAAAPAQPRIAIVGAGIAGLNCALALADKGLRSTVYEASPRIGGRMFSNHTGYWAEHQVSEWCGELIDTGHVTLRRLAARFGLPLDDLTASEPAGADETYYFDHSYYPRPQAVRAFAPAYHAAVADAKAAGYPTTCQVSTPAGLALDRMSVWDWIEKRVPGGHSSKLGQLLDVAYASEYGADTRVQSALNLVYMLSTSDQKFEIFGASDERYHVRGGNQQIPQAIAEHLAGRGMAVRTNQRLAAIWKQSDGSYALSLETGGARREEIADLVVLTLPFAVLRTLDYARAGFDRLKDQAIQQLGRGHIAKLQWQFTRRLWHDRGTWGRSTGSTFSDAGYQNTWEVTRAQAGKSGILSGYAGGSAADHLRARVPFASSGSAEVRQDASRFLGQIDRVFPGLAPLWNGKASSSLPHLSPFFQCAYSYWRVGQYHTIAGSEGLRQGHVFFAGEHTSQDFPGFMEGAAAEGARAARQILAQLGRGAHPVRPGR